MPRFLKRILWLGAVLLAVAAGATYALRDRLAAAVTQRALARITVAAAARGLELRELRVGHAAFVGVGAIRWDGVSGVAQMDVEDVWGARRDAVAFEAGQIVIDASWPWSERARVKLQQGRFGALDATGQPTGDQLTRLRLETELPLSWRKPAAVTTLLEQEVQRMMREGQTRLRLELTAIAEITVAGHHHEFNIRTAPGGSAGTRIVLDPEDIRRISATHTRKLTETEIAIVVENPHRAPALLRCSEKASQAAVALARRDRSFPADAYRHVYWSWMLTKAFGPTFSEEVTDAHEIGATYEFGNASRRMDLHNNAVGRAYALAAVPEAELVGRVLQDPNVMRAPSAAR